MQRLQVYSRGIDTAPGGTKKKPQQITLEQLSRRVTAQQLGFNEVMEMARRSSQFGAERWVGTTRTRQREQHLRGACVGFEARARLGGAWVLPGRHKVSGGPG